MKSISIRSKIAAMEGRENSDEKRAYEEGTAGGLINNLRPKLLKKAFSHAQSFNIDSARMGGGGGNDSDSNKSSGSSGMFRINQRLLSKEVQDKIN